MATHSSILAGKSHGGRSLVGYSPRGRKESDTTEQLHFCCAKDWIKKQKSSNNFLHLNAKTKPG